jgi:UDPglucose--hexose-1-phosphate uridylyltransferase
MDWTLRVVPNIFAAVNTQVNSTRIRDGIHLKAGGYGIADVLVESHLHNADITTLPLRQVEEIIKAYRYRYNEISSDPAINMVNIFRNHGGSAGASLKHPHSQIIGCMVAPPHVTDQIDYAKRAYNTWGNCVYCIAIDDELSHGTRVVQESEHFVAICPFASKVPYEIRLYPKRHSSVFGTINAEEESDLAFILQQILQRLKNLLGDPDYNFYIRSVTTCDGLVQFYHWYLTIVPRISHYAGFELGTGIFINTSSPEVCAEELRGIKLADIPAGIKRRL